ncbi:MAG: ribosome maturation factor RimM [Vicinamibacteria bacterium]
MQPFEDMVTIGRVVKPQGRKGEVLTAPLTDRPERFPKLRRAYVADAQGGAREIVVTACWPHKGRFVLKIAGVDSIDAAEAFRGLEIRIGEEALEALPAGSYYHHQLLGLKVEDPWGRTMGLAAEILETGGAPVLVVRGEGGEVLVPLAEEFIQAVDVARGRIVARRPELVDVES